MSDSLVGMYYVWEKSHFLIFSVDYEIYSMQNGWIMRDKAREVLRAESKQS
jgi:hypothetical protein